MQRDSTLRLVLFLALILFTIGSCSILSVQRIDQRISELYEGVGLR